MLIIGEYVGLRAKSYANELWDVESSEYHDERNFKGVSNRYLQKRIDFDDWNVWPINEIIIALGKERNEEEKKEKILTFVSYNMKCIL